jgi:hypothetical protein
LRYPAEVSVFPRPSAGISGWPASGTCDQSIDVESSRMNMTFGFCAVPPAVMGTVARSVRRTVLCAVASSLVRKSDATIALIQNFAVDAFRARMSPSLLRRSFPCSSIRGQFVPSIACT